MTAPLSDYAEFCKNYCISYLGSDDEVIDLLVKAREKLTEAYPEVRIYLLVSGSLNGKDVIQRNGVNWCGESMSYTREVTSIGDIHKILEESDVILEGGA